MNWLQLGLFASAIFAMYNVQQIKITLKAKGYPVEMFSGWMADFNNFKSLIETEEDERLKARYSGTLNSLYFSAAGFFFIAAYMLFGQGG